MNTPTKIEPNELTAARYSQINFIAHHLAQKLPLLRETGRFDGLAKSIVRSEISHFVVSGLFNIRLKPEVKESIANTDFIQCSTNKAVLLDIDGAHKDKLKALLVESLFSPTKANKRSRIVMVDGKTVSAESASQIEAFAFLDELIQLSVIVGYAEAGYSTFRRHSSVAPLWSLMPSAGDLRVAADLTNEEKVMTDFIFQNGSDYHFSINFFYPSDDPRHMTKEEILIVTNEELTTPLSELKERIKYVRDYERFKSCRVFLVNLNNKQRPVLSEPLTVYELKDELVERDQTDVDVCSVLDFVEIRDLIGRKYGLDTLDKGTK
ncbi:hypothetical protein [Photobacterium leiognathi]|uniref:hypothetical protein n=1 Tax=Photobacterium leiognathi TaxID=553611 RepID=UPI0029818F97|nr:hypothetical protein [Photobacterium leiognathi]